MIRHTSFALLALCGLAAACSPDPSAPHRALGPFLDSLMVEHEVPAVAFAVFDDTGLLYEHVSGVKDADSGEPVDAQTAFEAASISKPVFAHIVVTLAREGILPLDTPLAELVDEIPAIGYDPRSATLTPRMLLSHQGGLPNWRTRLSFEAERYEELFPAIDTLRFAAEPGEGYRYSGEGYVLLQQIVEELTGRSLTQLARERVLDPLGMSRSSFLFDDAMRANHARGHNREGAPDKWEIRMPLSSSTLHTTASDLAAFGSEIARQLRTGGPYARIGEPVVAVGASGEWEGSWGTGLGIVTDGERRFVYHGGNNVIFIADLIYGLEDNLGYAILTNSANGPGIVRAVQERFFGIDVRR
jgi:CubicO group peptidase (beta-lactamase class C family)